MRFTEIRKKYIFQIFVIIIKYTQSQRVNLISAKITLNLFGTNFFDRIGGGVVSCIWSISNRALRFPAVSKVSPFSSCIIICRAWSWASLDCSHFSNLFRNAAARFASWSRMEQKGRIFILFYHFKLTNIIFNWQQIYYPYPHGSECFIDNFFGIRIGAATRPVR